MEDPIDHIEWLPARELAANDYNPNTVFDAELRLLEFSILKTGWVQPILAAKDSREIIDGFHRWWLSQHSQQLLQRYGGLVPVALLDLTEPERMMLTVRINRAKGTHVAVKMADIIRRLVDVHEVPEKAIANGIGATLDEIRLLYQNDLWKRLDLDRHKYSRAWIPAQQSPKP